MTEPIKLNIDHTKECKDRLKVSLNKANKILDILKEYMIQTWQLSKELHLGLVDLELPDCIYKVQVDTLDSYRQSPYQILPNSKSKLTDSECEKIVNNAKLIVKLAIPRNKSLLSPLVLFKLSFDKVEVLSGTGRSSLNSEKFSFSNELELRECLNKLFKKK